MTLIRPPERFIEDPHQPAINIPTGEAALKQYGLLGEGIWIGAVGRKRTGKGVILSTLAWEAYLAGVPIFHFGNLRFGEHIDNLDRLIDDDPETFRNSLIFMDEVKGQMPRAKSSSTFQQILENRLNQSGHFNISILWANPSTRGISEILHEQTDWVIWIEAQFSGKQAWWDHGDEPCFTAKKQGRCNHCPAFDDSDALNVFHRGPNAVIPMPGLSDCRDMPVKHMINFTLSSQPGSRYGSPEEGGIRIPNIPFYCAQRFYGLTNTDQFIDNRATLLTNSESLHEKGMATKVNAVRRVVLDMYEANIHKASPQDFIDWIDENPGKFGAADELNVVSIGKALGNLGVPRRGRQPYNLESWVKARYTVAGAS